MIPVKTVVAVDAIDARRLYFQGYSICTSSDKHTTQIEVQKDTNPVPEDFFKQPGVFGLVLGEQESQELKQFQKHSLWVMVGTMALALLVINLFFVFLITNNFWVLGGTVFSSYFMIHGGVRVFDLSKRPENVFLRIMDKYRLSVFLE